MANDEEEPESPEFSYDPTQSPAERMAAAYATRRRRPPGRWDPVELAAIAIGFSVTCVIVGSIAQALYETAHIGRGGNGLGFRFTLQLATGWVSGPFLGAALVLACLLCWYQAALWMDAWEGDEPFDYQYRGTRHTRLLALLLLIVGFLVAGAALSWAIDQLAPGSAFSNLTGVYDIQIAAEGLANLTCAAVAIAIAGRARRICTAALWDADEPEEYEPEEYGAGSDEPVP